MKYHGTSTTLSCNRQNRIQDFWSLFQDFSPIFKSIYKTWLIFSNSRPFQVLSKNYEPCLILHRKLAIGYHNFIRDFIWLTQKMKVLQQFSYQQYHHEHLKKRPQFSLNLVPVWRKKYCIQDKIDNTQLYMWYLVWTLDSIV